MIKTTEVTGFNDSKPHYAVLDGLRGVAALMVVWYHIHEGLAFAGSVNGVGDGMITQFNHGYLAVDFFFLLSGFVLGYAYGDRWKQNFGLKTFLKRRLIRLHPMVVTGSIIGMFCFLLQGSQMWNGNQVPISAVMVAMLCAMFMIPALPKCYYEVRGNGEMFPLNGPTWSLFFEYIGNLLYALFIRRFSTRLLTWITVILGLLSAGFTAFNVSGYDMLGVGWTLDTMNFCGGLLRMLFPYTFGMLLARKFKPVHVKSSFWWGTLILMSVFSVPYLSSDLQISINGLYETLCITCIFPILIWLGASDLTTGCSSLLCSFLGRLSYPLYLVHYPIFYLFYNWLIKNKVYFLSLAWKEVLIVLFITLTVAIIVMKWVDEPIRERLAKR